MPTGKISSRLVAVSVPWLRALPIGLFPRFELLSRSRHIAVLCSPCREVTVVLALFQVPVVLLARQTTPKQDYVLGIQVRET